MYCRENIHTDESDFFSLYILKYSPYLKERQIVAKNGSEIHVMYKLFV
jgi:hypothetical protein